MKRMCRISAGLLAVLLLLLSLVSCVAARPLHASPRAKKAVATAGDVEILYEELYFIAMNRIEELKKTHGENVLADKEQVEALEKFVWENLLTRETALISLGYQYGLDVHEGDIADNVQTLMDGIMEDNFENDRDAYINSLAEMHMTDHYARRYFGVEEYLANAIVLEMLYRGEVETDDEKVLAAINSERFIRTVHVFISKTDAAYTAEEDRAHAEEIRAEIAAAADDAARYRAMFEAIGGKYNNDFGDPLGHGYYFTRGEMKAAYEDAAFALPEYGVSDVVEIDEGFYVIMRLPKDAAYITENFETLKEKSYFVTLNQKVEEQLAAMTLEKTRFGEGLDFANLPAIDPDGGSTVIVIAAAVGGVLICAAFVLAFFRFYKKRGDAQ